MRRSLSRKVYPYVLVNLFRQANTEQGGVVNSPADTTAFYGLLLTNRERKITLVRNGNLLSL